MKISLKNKGVFFILAIGWATGNLHCGAAEDVNTRNKESYADTLQNPYAKEASPINTRQDTVTIKLMKFDPEEVHIQKGHTVIWINEDIVNHNVMKMPDTAFVSSTISSGSLWKMKVEESFDYICGIHPTMKGKIIVDP